MLPYLGHEFITCLMEKPLPIQDEAFNQDLMGEGELLCSSRELEREDNPDIQLNSARPGVFAVYIENCMAMRLFRRMFGLEARVNGVSS